MTRIILNVVAAIGIFFLGAEFGTIRSFPSHADLSGGPGVFSNTDTSYYTNMEGRIVFVEYDWRREKKK